jgi:uncharacterized protein DUF4124
MRFIVLLLAATGLAFACHAQQAYKWVDAQGRTHYSQNKADAPGANMQAVDITPPPRDASGTRRVASSASSPTPKSKPTPLPRVPSPPPSWEVRSDRHAETDSSRCELARAILNGSAQRRRGPVVDQNDRTMAQNDVKAFCK